MVHLLMNADAVNLFGNLLELSLPVRVYEEELKSSVEIKTGVGGVGKK